MMSSLYGVGTTDAFQHGYATDAIFDELSRQLTSSDSMRRVSRGSSNGPRPGGAMRVVKPSSANNSPRTSMMARRRTFMNDVNLARRRQQVLDQTLQMPAAGFNPYEAMPEPSKSTTSRPVSWHPSSHIQTSQAPLQQQHQHQHQLMPQQYPQYIMPTPLSYNEMEAFPAFQQHPFPPTPAAYSQQASPTAAFSPLSLPVQGVSQTYCPPLQGTPDTWHMSAQQMPYHMPANPSPEFNLPQPALPEQNTEAAHYPPIDWNYFATNGFSNSTAPPTPDHFPTFQSEPTVPTEEAIPFKPLEEPEEEGEILVGMGLYDTPDKADEDPELDNYRSSTSHLLGTTYRQGKGLKLEEAWEPPASDEEEEDDDNDEEDADGDDQDDEESDSKEADAEQTQGNWI